MIKNYIEIPIDQLIKADWNYKKEHETTKEKLKENIKRNGQIENIIVRRLDSGFYEVVNGNHRFDAIKDLEIETAICYDLGKYKGQEKHCGKCGTCVERIEALTGFDETVYG